MLFQQPWKDLRKPIQSLSRIAKTYRDIRQIIIKKVPHRVKQLTSLQVSICQVGGVLNGAKLQGFYVGF
jgi:hypothetical protein